MRTVGERAVLLVWKARPWAQCVDPAQVFVLSMARIVWRVHTWKDVTDDLGRCWDLERTPTAQLAHAARLSAMRMSDVDAMSRQPEGRGAWRELVAWRSVRDAFCLKTASWDPGRRPRFAR